MRTWYFTLTCRQGHASSVMISCQVGDAYRLLQYHPATGFILQPHSTCTMTQHKPAPTSGQLLHEFLNCLVYSSLLVGITADAQTGHMVVLILAFEQVDNHKRNCNNIFMVSEQFLW